MHDQTAKTDQNHHENKIRMRTLIDEVKALKEHKEAAEVVEMNQHDNIDVIVSHTLTDGARLVSAKSVLVFFGVFCPLYFKELIFLLSNTIELLIIIFLVKNHQKEAKVRFRKQI